MKLCLATLHYLVVPGTGRYDAMHPAAYKWITNYFRANFLNINAMQTLQ